MPWSSPRGIHLEVAESLLHQIEVGDLVDALPSAGCRMRSHDVARNTVRCTLQALEAHGVVESARGIGWRVVRGDDRPSLTQRMVGLIAEDLLSVGDAYPSEARLCGLFEASWAAVRRALAQMEGNRLLAASHGKGRAVHAL